MPMTEEQIRAALPDPNVETAMFELAREGPYETGGYMVWKPDQQKDPKAPRTTVAALYSADTAFHLAIKPQNGAQ